MTATEWWNKFFSLIAEGMSPQKLAMFLLTSDIE